MINCLPWCVYKHVWLNSEMDWLMASAVTFCINMPIIRIWSVQIGVGANILNNCLRVLVEVDLRFRCAYCPIIKVMSKLCVKKWLEASLTRLKLGSTIRWQVGGSRGAQTLFLSLIQPTNFLMLLLNFILLATCFSLYRAIFRLELYNFIVSPKTIIFYMLHYNVCVY
jgi:hypothetical protein